MNYKFTGTSFIIFGVLLMILTTWLHFGQYLPLNIISSEYKDATYYIDGNAIDLDNGMTQTEIEPGSASKLTTKYFGNETRGDFNNDGNQDVVFLLTQNSGGSGTFFYVVAALGKKEGGYNGTNGIFLGDRIAPQTTEFHDGQIIVNYADRNPQDAMTDAPSRGVSKYLYIAGDSLVEGKINQVACTLEAKICPDGSSVGRTGPNCEFSECPNITFGSIISLSVDQEAKLEDGLIVKLLNIDDSRCKEGVVCVWEGELSAKLNVIIGGANKEIRLSSSTQKETSESIYSFKMQSITENSINFVVFRGSSIGQEPCYVGGCSSEVCSDQKDVASNCIYKSEYACYKTATCERQASGQCGWTQSSTLTACISNSK